MSQLHRCCIPLLALGAMLLAGCSKPEDKLVGQWTGSGQIHMSTGNPQFDQMMVEHPQNVTYNLDLRKDKTYTEKIQQESIEGSWSLSGTTLTLTPKSINGQSPDQFKQQIASATSRLGAMGIKVPDAPGTTGPEQVTVSQDYKSLSVPSIGATITLSKAAGAQ